MSAQLHDGILEPETASITTSMWGTAALCCATVYEESMWMRPVLHEHQHLPAHCCSVHAWAVVTLHRQI